MNVIWFIAGVIFGWASLITIVLLTIRGAGRKFDKEW